jgi:1-acyl-sn-glycerol-3-phosphate acyltransferase
VWPPRDGAFVYNAVDLVMTVVKPLFCRLKAEGIENMPLQGGCVLTCNHTMGPDFLFVGYASRRQVYFMAKQELFEIYPALTWLFNTAGAFPIRRGEADLVAVGHAIDLVKSGHVLGMFPEGTRSRYCKVWDAATTAGRCQRFACFAHLHARDHAGDRRAGGRSGRRA